MNKAVYYLPFGYVLISIFLTTLNLSSCSSTVEEALKSTENLASLVFEPIPTAAMNSGEQTFVTLIAKFGDGSQKDVTNDGAVVWEFAQPNNEVSFVPAGGNNTKAKLQVRIGVLQNASIGVSATYGGQSATASLNINATSLSSMALSLNPQSVATGEITNSTLEAIYADTFSEVWDSTNPNYNNLTWTSSNPNVAIVDTSGTITLNSVGSTSVETTVITATYKMGTPEELQANTTLTVTPPSIKELTIFLSQSNVQSGGPVGYSVTATFNDGSKADVSTYSNLQMNSDSSAVTFSNSGGAGTISTAEFSNSMIVNIDATLQGITSPTVQLQIDSLLLEGNVNSSSDDPPKKLTFRWNTVTNATQYQLLYSPDGIAEYLSPNGVGFISGTTQAVEVAVHLIDWDNARYKIRACNSANTCFESSPIAINQTMLSAIGYIKAFDAAQDDHFGGAVAVSENGLILAAGAPLKEISIASGAIAQGGAVYIYERQVDPLGGYRPWRFVKMLTAYDVTVGEQFGFSISVNHDGSLIAVGAWGDYKPGLDPNGIPKCEIYDSVSNTSTTITNATECAWSGAVYIYSRGIDNWGSTPTKLKAFDAGQSAYFGYKINISSTGNMLAVGASIDNSADLSGNCNGQPATNVLCDGSGAIYVFNIDPTTGNPTKLPDKLKAPTAGQGERFGSYSISLNSSGTVLAVGSAQEDSVSADGTAGTCFDNKAIRTDGVTTCKNSGSVHIFYPNSSGDWTAGTSVTLKAPRVGISDLFGDSVSFDASGKILAVGAQNDDFVSTDGSTGTCIQLGVPINGTDNCPGSGSVYVFYRDTLDSWTTIAPAVIKEPNVSFSARFSRVSLNSDGTILAVGAYGQNEASPQDSCRNRDGTVQTNVNSCQSSGAAYVFQRDTQGGWSMKSSLKAPNAGNVDSFGVAISLNGNGTVLTVGAEWEGKPVPIVNDPIPSVIKAVVDGTVLSNSGAVYLY